MESVFLYEDQEQGPYFIFLESLNTNNAGIARMHPMCLVFRSITQETFYRHGNSVSFKKWNKQNQNSSTF